MSFLAILIHLTPKQKTLPLTTEAGEYAHAAIVRTLSNTNPEMAQNLDKMARHKCFTIAILPPNSQHQNTLRVTFWGQEGQMYVHTLLDAFKSYPEIELKQNRYEVSEINLTDAEWGGSCNLLDLTGERGAYFHFIFVTPTAITKQNRHGKKFVELLPQPIDIFSGLAKRWIAIGGKPLPNAFEQFLQEGGCVISQIQHLETRLFHTTERTQIGFIGSLTYSCLEKLPVYQEALSQLTRLAFFTGVGYQTTRGMGLVKTRVRL
jgi:CRISPR-associated endoribonuclease Cas6